MLTDGQDPESLEARVAYHLHRLRLSGGALAETRYLSRPRLQDLAQGRLPITVPDAMRVAALLGVDAGELMRPLDERECEAWGFYRASARHREYVWQRTRSVWEQAGISLRLAAEIMELRHYSVVQVLRDGRRGLILHFEAAERLTTTLMISEGPNFLVADVGGLSSPDHNVATAVRRLTIAEIDGLQAKRHSSASRVVRQTEQGR